LRNTSEKSPLLPNESNVGQSIGRIDSPFRYPGGKFYALKFIMPFVDQIQHDEYREPLVGGGAVFFAKKKVRFDWLNDLNKDLMITYQVMADPDLRIQLCRLLSKEPATRARHAQVKSLKPTTPLEVAFRTYYLNRTSFSGIIYKPAWGYKIGQSVEPRGWPRKIVLAGRKLEGTRLTAIDFEEVVRAPAQGERVFMYVDPPYYTTDQRRAYEKSFTKEDHKRLLDCLNKTNFYFCLSYDDCPQIRDMYSWANIHSREWWYNTANCRGTPRTKGRELIITNYEVKHHKNARLLV